MMPGVDHLQNIHPLLVHFPLALLPAAALVYCLAIVGRRDAWAWAGLWMLALGALGAAVSVASGLWAAPGVMIAISVKEHLLNPHRNLMLAVLGISVVLTFWALAARPIPGRGRYAFLAMLVVMVALIAKGADYGGRMVFDYNAAGSACGQPINFSR
jgi:uncharacterized membrane protein